MYVAHVSGDQSIQPCRYYRGAPNAGYGLFTAADNSSVVRCGIANSVHQMHEASGRILVLARTALLYEITGDEAGVPWIR
jgi:hypothetical protein